MYEFQFGIWDLLDILIIALVIYRLMMLIRGTQAHQVFVGTVIFIIFAVVGFFLNLSGITWIIKSIKRYWVVVIVVIFQREIRQSLAQLGRSRLFKYLTGSQKGLIDEIVITIDRMRRNGYGAIIVFEREIGLGEFVSQGVQIGARVYAELLVSIFTPGGPLHDGAVILQNERIAACSVMLPLSTNPSIARFLGARHRAAVGITEVSDAVAVVVSEETRVISLSYNGRLITCKDLEAFKSDLQKMLAGKYK